MLKKNNANSPNFPLKTKLRLKMLRQGTELILPIIKTDKYAPNVISRYNIPYAAKDSSLQKFDWHYPISRQLKNGIKPTPTLFYIHGGAWSSADKKVYSRLCKDLAQRGFVVININYRLLPEYDLEVTYQDCVTAIQFCLQHADKLGIDPSKLIIGGDSAGAHLSALIAGKITTNNLTINGNIVGTVLIYGVYNLNHLADSKFSVLPPLHEGFKKAKGKSLGEFYHNFSPIYYVTPKFPPSFLTVGMVDLLYPETVEFIEILNANGVKNKSLIFPKDRKDGRHAFINLNSPARQEAVMTIGKTIQQFVKKV